MNFSLHITSLSGKSFEAYPLDDKADYLKSFCTDVDGNALAMWTEHGIMYYYSIFKLPNDSVFGLLLSFKDMVITRPRALLKIMSGIVIDQMPKRGKILQYSATGDLVFVNNNFADDPQAIDGLRSEVHKTLTLKGREIGCKTMALPALSSPKDVVAVSATEDYSSIQNFIFTQRNAVVISTEATYTSDATYAVISGLQAKIQEKEAELDSRAETIKQLERSRKQYRFVLVLLGILLAAGIGLYKLNGTLTATEHSLSQANDSISDYRVRLSDANDTISARERHIGQLNIENGILQDKNHSLSQAKTNDSLRQEGIIQSLHIDISNLEYSQNNLRATLSKTENDLSRANSKNRKLRSLTEVYPFLATGYSKAGSTLYISYNAPIAKSSKIVIKFFTTSAYIGSYTTTVSVKEGSGKLTFSDDSLIGRANYMLIYYGSLIIGGCWF